MTMFSSVFSCLSAFCPSGVKLLFGNEADCKVEVTLLLMLSLVDSDSLCWRDRTPSTSIVCFWMEYIDIILTYRHPVFKLPSDISILYHLLTQRRFIPFYFQLVLTAFPIWCCLGCDNSYTLSLLSCSCGNFFHLFYFHSR